MSTSKSNLNIFFRTERRLKLLILLISFVFWLFVKLSKDYRTSATMSVDWHLPDSLVWSNPPPASMLISYRGEGWSLLRSYVKQSLIIQPEQLEGEQIVLGRRDILPHLEQRFSEDIEILDFTPDNFVLAVDKRLTQKFPVRLIANPQYKQGYTQNGSIVVSPDSVLVTGPQEVLGGMTFIETELWEPQKLQTSVVDHSIRLNNPEGKLIIQPNTVQVSIGVEQLTEKSFFVPVVVLNAKDSIRIFPDKIRITFSVPLSQFDHIKPEDFELVANFAGVKSGSNNNTLPINVRKQPNVISSLRFRSKAIEFFIEKK